MKSILSTSIDIPESNKQIRFFKELNKTIGSENIPFIDRTQMIDAPIRYKVCEKNQLLSGRYITSFSYEECCLRKAEEIVRIQDLIQKPIAVSYSGGIDSTAIVCSFIHLLGIKEAARRVHIYMSTDSILEYPKFFFDTLLPNFSIFPITRFVDCFGSQNIFVDGEPNGLIVFTDWLAQSINKFGVDFFKGPVSVNSVDTIARIKQFDYKQTHVQALFEMNKMSADKFGVELENMLDWIWWFNFNFRYQWYLYLNIRKFQIYYPEFEVSHDFFKSHFVCFFDSDDFQNWSITNRQQQLDNIDPKKFKLPCKDLIYKVTKDPVYWRIKGKVHSGAYPVKMEHFVFGIDEDYKPVSESEIENYLVDSAFLSSFI